MTKPVCIGEPVSWLRLERYQQGELLGPDRAAIAAHLAACPACKACLDQIQTDEAVALPPFELPQRRSPSSAASRARARWLPRWRAGQIAPLVGGLAVAALVMIAVGRSWVPGGPLVGPGGAFAVKGGDVTLTLVRDDGTKLTDEGAVFRESDRFKVLVTCPPAMRATFDVVVLDTSGASFPLPQAETIACGNEVPLHGAFRLTGAEPERVCVVWYEKEATAPDRARIAAGGPELERRCKDLRPAQTP